MAAHDDIEVTGMVLQALPVGEYNRRIVLLTAEKGKITAFARGARKPGSRFMGDTEPFSFGKFRLIRGRDAYTLTDVNISRHFEKIRDDYEAAILGMYFLEVAEYYTRENLEAYEEINLIYASLLALLSEKFDRRLVRSVYEIKSLVIEGEYPGIPNDRIYSEAARYALDFISGSDIKKLYSFSLKEEVLEEVGHISRYLMDTCVEHKFKSLDLL